MRRRGWILLGALVLLAPPAAASARIFHHPTRAQVRPREFVSCAQLVGYERRYLRLTRGRADPSVVPLVGPPVRQPGAPAPQATTEAPAAGDTTFSTTNNQEAGVDEPDIVKTDGSTIFTISGNKLFAVAVTGGAPRLVGSLVLGGAGYGGELFLHGDRLIVISGAATPGPGPIGVAMPALAPRYVIGSQTIITEVDVGDPSAMKIARTMTFDGRFVDGRENGATARVVISSTPRGIYLDRVRAKASGWVPSRYFHSRLTGRHYVRAAAACDTIRHPVRFSGMGMLTIVTIDLARGLWAADSDALLADAQVVYGSQKSLYVATQKWVDPATAPADVPASDATVIHRFDVSDPERTTLVSSGEVPGYLLNQFSLSEYNGHLRVATTSRPIWWTNGPPPDSQSYVTVLDQHGGVLVPVGQVAGLGKGQKIYSVRFVDDAGYVVTFRQIDPLYTLDLSSPSAPRVAGELELRGYSAYLHPISRDLLLGVGVDVAPSGNEPSGAQLELFDVSEPAKPALLARTTLGAGSSSEVQFDHHAFLYWAPTGLAVLPVEVYDASSPFVGAVGFHVDRSGIAAVGRIVHDAINGYSPAIHRSVVIGDRLFTVSDGGVMVSALSTLARQAFVAYPASQAP